MKLKFSIDSKSAGQRLDKFLFDHLNQPEQLIKLSRTYLQKLVKDGKISVNDNLTKQSHKLKIDDLIEAEIILPEEISLEPDHLIKLNIVYEDDNTLVLDKPAGLVVHPSPTTKRNTLVNGLLAYLPSIREVGEDPLRPGIVHRLDKNTSGLMIVAKNNEAFYHLKKQFQERVVIKKYLALVSGCPPADEGIIEAPIERSGRTPTKQKISFSESANPAITEYKIIKKIGKKYCLVEAMPKTGRMHQIRIHFAHFGHPVVNDKKYGGPPIEGLEPADRQFLHAAYLKIKLPDQLEAREFFSSLPIDLKRCLDKIEKVDLSGLGLAFQLRRLDKNNKN